MHPRALMRDITEDNLDQQPTLDGAFPRQAKPPTFTTDGLLDYMIELIVCEDKARLYAIIRMPPSLYIYRLFSLLTKVPSDASSRIFALHYQIMIFLTERS